ncbi:CMD domain-containing protein [Erwinia rhapontici]|uniref:CMD domain-containing protein n=1 Tax=Erwinia rhapontici TaxID=55212 RepID=UPI003BA14E4C
MIDAIDKAAGLAAEDALYATRRFRPEFVQGAELCRLSVLHPENDQGLSAAWRHAVALRIVTLNADTALIAEYSAQLAALTPDDTLLAFASGASVCDEPLATLARHVDRITLTPGEAKADDIARLAGAGFNNPQIVALSELIAFVNFQTKVASGLRLMRLL